MAYNNDIESEELSRFEKELNQFTFRGIPVGSLIGSHLNLDFLYGKFNPNDYLKELALHYYIKYLPAKHIKGFDFEKHEKSKRLPILTFLSGRRHIFNMSIPVFEELGAENVFCLIKNEKVLSQFKIKPKHYAFFNELPTYQYKTWRKAFNKLWYQIEKVVSNFIQRNEIHQNYKLRLKNNLLGETRYILAFEKMLDFLKPEYLLTHYDRYAYLAALFSVAKSQSIRTYTLMHGVISNSIGYTPLVADKVFVWGERQKSALINYNVQEKKIAITGAPQLSKEIVGDKQVLKQKLGLSTSDKVIVLATNPTKEEFRIKLFRLFCDSMKNLANKNFIGLIKLHPSENVSFYKNIADIPANVFFDVDTNITFEESFALADLVCNYNSAFAIDAILKELPLVTINVNDKLLGQAKDYIETGNLPVAYNSRDLASIIDTYFNDKVYANDLVDKIKAYSKRYCLAYSKKAASKILKIISDDKRSNE